MATQQLNSIQSSGAGAPAPAHPALAIGGLSKTFGTTRALVDVSLSIRHGEIHALVGQNGSGKSTLIKALARYHAPDTGAWASLDGEPFQLGHDAPAGLRFVHQDLGLVLELNAVDNLALHSGFARGAGGRILWREQARVTRRLLDRFGVELDIHRPLKAATPVERTVVAIAAALQGWQGGPGVLVLDEPTAVLPHDEVERLFAMVREVRRAGTSVLYVSHRLDEIFELADRVTVLRGGSVIATRSVEEVDARGLASLMVGEDVDPDYRAPVAARPDTPTVLEARDLRGRWLRGVDLDVHRGEILGIAGLEGAGAMELPYVLATAHGLPIVPADRAGEGVIAEFAVGENLTLSVLARLRRQGRVSRSAESALVAEWTRRLDVVAAGPQARISTLSGGNQQKVVLARCLAREPQVLVLCEPTAGVDVGTRVAIYDLVAGLARDGLTVIVASTDVGDLLAMCTRVLVLRHGRVAAELDGDGLTQHAVVRAIEGGEG